MHLRGNTRKGGTIEESTIKGGTIREGRKKEGTIKEGTIKGATIKKGTMYVDITEEATINYRTIEANSRSVCKQEHVTRKA